MLCRGLCDVLLPSNRHPTSQRPPKQEIKDQSPPIDIFGEKNLNPLDTRDQRVAVFNFGTDRVQVLEKTSGSGTDWVRVLALHFYQLGIIGY